MALACTACSTMPDGPARRIEWRQFTDQTELNRACDSRMPSGTSIKAMLSQRPAGRVEGCFRLAGDTCVINTMKVGLADQREIHDTIGHEVRHCFDGLFHSGNKS
jgi:hypothetical protein